MIDRLDPTDSDAGFRDRPEGPRSDYAPQGTDQGTRAGRETQLEQRDESFG